MIGSGYKAQMRRMGCPRRIGRTNGGLNSKLHAVCDGRAARSFCY